MKNLSLLSLVILLVLLNSSFIHFANASTEVWSKTYGGSSGERAYSLVETPDEGYALAGETYSFDVGHGDVWLLKTDFEGNMLRNQTYGGTGYEGCFSLIEVSTGGFALAGTTDSLGSGSVYFYFMKTDAHGIIPEFPSWTLLFTTMVAGVAVVFFFRDMLKKKRRFDGF